MRKLVSASLTWRIPPCFAAARHASCPFLPCGYSDAIECSCIVRSAMHLHLHPSILSILCRCQGESMPPAALLPATFRAQQNAEKRASKCEKLGEVLWDSQGC